MHTHTTQVTIPVLVRRDREGKSLCSLGRMDDVALCSRLLWFLISFKECVDSLCFPWLVQIPFVLHKKIVTLQLTPFNSKYCTLRDSHGQRDRPVLAPQPSHLWPKHRSIPVQPQCTLYVHSTQMMLMSLAPWGSCYLYQWGAKLKIQSKGHPSFLC